MNQPSDNPLLPHPPQRVVSLLPSMTENLFVLGFGASLVGITNYCIHPAAGVKDLPRLGGPQTPDIGKMAALQPELVFASPEETPAPVLAQIEAAGLKLWLSHPKTADEAVELLRSLLALYHSDRAAVQVNTLQSALDHARLAAEGQPGVRLFCPLWMEQVEGQTRWVVFNWETYMHDLLQLVGAKNVFAEREAVYPRVSAADVAEADPQVILLPNDPFHFHEEHIQLITDELADTEAVREQRIYKIEGSLIVWPGVRLGKALQELPSIFTLEG